MPEMAAPLLPKTIEGALVRYLKAYTDHYPKEDNPVVEVPKMVDLIHAKVSSLGMKAPVFYEQKLPQFLNQAASRLLATNFNRPEGREYFHKNNRYFCRLLDELLKSQPAHDVNLESEIRRIQEKDKLLREADELRQIISELDAAEIDTDDLGEDEPGSMYNRIWAQLDIKKARLQVVSYKIASMEGENIEEDITFELRPEPHGLLDRLEPIQQQMIEDEILKIMKDNRKDRQSWYFTIVDFITPTLAKAIKNFASLSCEDKAELNHELLEAVKKYIREGENERRNNFLDYLLRNKALRPKEGLIITSPEDVPEDVRRRLEDSDRKSKREMEALAEATALSELQEEAAGLNGTTARPEDPAENLDDDSSIEEGLPINHELKIVMDEIKAKPEFFARVKEEPRDDYQGDAPSDDEFTVDAEVADDVEAALHLAGPSGYHENGHSKMEVDDQDDDDELEELGVVRPEKKVELVDLADSDDD